MELVLNMLAEATTTELSKAHNPQGLKENKEIARRGGKVAGETRKSIEAETGKSVITNQNAAELNAVVTNMIETVAEDNTEKYIHKQKAPLGSRKYCIPNGAILMLEIGTFDLAFVFT